MFTTLQEEIDDLASAIAGTVKTSDLPALHKQYYRLIAECDRNRDGQEAMRMYRQLTRTIRPQLANLFAELALSQVSSSTVRPTHV